MNNKILFHEFEVDTLKRTLRKGGVPVVLNPKAFDLLLALASRPGEIVSKQDLLDSVWKNQFVEEKNLTVHVAALRKVFGETKNENRFIVTVPGTGYKFVADVRSDPRETGSEGPESTIGGDSDQVGDEERHSPEGPTPRFSKHKQRTVPISIVAGALVLATGLIYFSFFYKVRTGPESIAVLPLVNVTGDTNVDFLSDGITENLINDLSQFPDLKVIARSSVFRYKTNDNRSLDSELGRVAADLGVRTVLTGRLEKRGENLLISVELVDVSNQTQLWGEHYDRKIADVFAVQEEIARNIAERLHLKLSGKDQRDVARRYTDNLQAFESYMMGRAYIHRRTREDLLTAKGYYEKAIEQDQNYALAYSGLAEVYGNLTVRGYIPSVDGRKKFRDSAEKAVSLDDTLAEGHVMKGFAMTGMAPYDFAGGDPELRQAIDLSPSLAIAHLYLSLSLLKQGDYDGGLAEMLKARELDPFSAIIARQVGLAYILKRDNAHALQIFKQADDGGAAAFTSTTEVDAYVQSRSFEDALTKITREEERRKDDPLLIFSKGMIYAAQGKHAEAEHAVQELRRLSGSDTDQAQWIAKIYAQLGDKEQALQWLENGANAETIGAFYKDEPVWDSVRGLSRFNIAIRRFGIPQ